MFENARTLKFALFACMLMLAGCATPGERVGRELVELGVPERQALCMGDRLGQRLSTGQLRRLQDIARLNGDRLERMTIREIASRLTDDRDPALIAEFIRAGIGCAI